MALSIKNLNIYKFLKFLSINLTSVFIPIFVYSTTKSIPLTLLYLIFSSIITISFNLILKNVFSKHFNLTLVLSFIVFIPSQLLIIFNNMNPYLYMVIMAFSQGIDKVLTNSLVDYLYNLSPKSEDAKNLKDTYLVGACAIILSSIVGGVMLEYLHNAYTIGLAIFISLVSMIFILVKVNKIKKCGNMEDESKNETVKEEPKNIEVIDNQKKINPNRKYVLILAVSLMLIIGVYLRGQLTWGIYLDIENIKLTVIGIVNALIPLGQIITNYLIYKFTLKNNENLLLAISSVAIGICWILRLFLLDNFSIYFFTVVIGILDPFLYQPIKYIYLHSLKQYTKPSSYLYLDECVRQVGCLLCSLIGIIFSFLGVTGLKVMYIISAVILMLASIIYMFLNRRLKKVDADSDNKEKENEENINGDENNL